MKSNSIRNNTTLKYMCTTIHSILRRVFLNANVTTNNHRLLLLVLVPILLLSFPVFVLFGGFLPFPFDAIGTKNVPYRFVRCRASDGPQFLAPK